MKKIITLLLGTFLCVLSFAENNSSAIVYADDSLSAELKIVDDAKYQGCATCLLKPTECNIKSSNN